MANLNASQRQAVYHDLGPLLIVAGAGTGKTTVLIERLAYLINDKKVAADDILLLTFTEKATAEMTERADKALPYGYLDLWINTFHSFGERLLRTHGLDIGLNPDFKLLTTAEQWVMIKQNLDRFNLDYYQPLGNPNKFIHELVKHFSRLKDENVAPLEYLQFAKDLGEDRIIELANAYHVYNQLLLEKGYLDFGDLIFYTIKLLKDRPQILESYRMKFKYIMVDEFQDTNWAQYELVKLLSAPNHNLVAVGDDDQSIYKFRGASISNIMQFKDDFPGAKELVLTENYRSCQEILDAAYHFIQQNNPNRLEEKLQINKQLIASRESIGDDRGVIFQSFGNEAAEINFVADKIIMLTKADENLSLADIAVLVRANDTAEKYLKEFRRRGIPHYFVSSKGLYYKTLILDIISYFKLLDNYHESPAVFRVLNMEMFKVSYPDIIALNRLATQHSWSLFEALKNINLITNDLEPESVNAVNRLLGLIATHSQAVKNSLPSKIFLNFIYDSGLLASFDRDLDRDLYSYLESFFKKIKEFEDLHPDARLTDFMELLALELEAGESGSVNLEMDDAEVVRIMTVHAAKGLEFKYVFLVDLVDKRFPTIVHPEKIPLPDGLIKERFVNSGTDFHLEEERRLFYVALTRAKNKLFLSAAKDCGGARLKKPSRFLGEMGIQIINDNEEVKVDVFKLPELSKVGNNKPLPPPTHFSFSQLAAFDTCPLQYKFGFILKVPILKEKSSFQFGKLIHDCLYEYFLPLLQDQQVLSNIDVVYDKRFPETGWDSALSREKYRQKGKEILKSFLKQLTSVPKVLFLEKDFSFPFHDNFIKGKIDRVDELPDGTLEIVDYKTGNPKPDLKPGDKQQLLLYCLFLEDFLKRKVSKLTFYYLENNSQLTFLPKEKEMIKFQDDMLKTINNIKAMDFPPAPGEMCKFCDFRGICEFRK